jgi:hypothetical protein
MILLDYSTGNFKQWLGGVQQKAPGRATIIAPANSPFGDGRYAARFQVYPGDYLGTKVAAERCEALTTVAQIGGREGTVLWVGWRTRIDPADVFLPVAFPGWHLFTDLHASGAVAGGYNLQFQLNSATGNFEFERQGKTGWTRVLGPWSKGQPHTFVFGVSLSHDPAKGWVEVWLDGKNVLPRTPLQTLISAADSVYLKQGYYREHTTNVGVIEHAGTRVGPTYASVLGAFPAPPPPPPPTSSVWAWDATAATVAGNSAAVIAATGFPQAVYFEASVALAYTALSAGVEAGHNDDHHLCVIGQNTQTDYWHARPAGPVWTGDGIANVPPGAAFETAPGSSNAARFPLDKWLVTPADLAVFEKYGTVTHGIVFSVGNAGPAPCPYPANTKQGGTGSGLTFGQWVRLPAGTPTAGLDLLTRYVIAALAKHGGLCRDTGGFSVYGVDACNQGGQVAKWAAVGITLDDVNPAYSPPYPYATKLDAIPWSKLELLEPPSP